ncbi:btk-binding protein-related [Anaeramoeba flamelloides]|uniref:Btk-binding protein-related n=1 Tax=Anaeramoeba flamelloides TaxID=1746091 RepID=A0ABQ8YT26_9EUKA|nr:btk-binding protein-related [Anaeramoeba flamelloides]
MTEEKQYLYRVKGKTVTNETSTHKNIFSHGGGGNGNQLYVDESTCATDIKNNNSFSNIKNVIEVAGGYTHCIFLTQEGVVYGVGSASNGNLGNDNKFSQRVPRPITFFQKNNLKVRKISAGVFQSYFITEKNKFYACGLNGNHQLGLMETTQTMRTPKIITEKEVENVWSGNYAYAMYYKELESGKVIGCGQSLPKNPHILTNDKNFKDKEVVKIEGGSSTFLFLLRTKQGVPEVYVSNSTGPTLWEELSGYKINNLGMCCHNCLFTTEDNKVLASDSTGNSFTDVTSQLPEIPKSQYWKMGTQAWDALLFNVDANLNSLFEDLKNVYENQILVDGTFSNNSLSDLKVHKTWLECRLKQTFQKIDQLFQGLDYETCEELINWAYGLVLSSRLSQNSVKFLNSIQVSPNAGVEDDLLSLYTDEESKNFNILVKIDDQDEDEDEDEDEEEFEEIPVHKFILILKSGLFREMFQNVTEQSNSVPDYSGKSIESLEILIKFFYTDTIELTADDDPQMIVEDFNDVVEYYKLNEKSNVKYELNKIKKLFNIN